MYLQFEPPEDLKHLVCFFYAMEHHSEDEPLQHLLPSGTAVNGWQYAGRWRLLFIIKGAPQEYLLPEFYMVGQQTVGYKLTAAGGLTGIFGAALQPGTLHRLSGQPAYHYTNNPVDSHIFFGAGKVQSYIRRFRQAGSNDERLSLLAGFYRSFNLPPCTDIFDSAVRLIFEHKGCLSVSTLCDKLHVNERYLQREFRKKLGVPPLAYIQVIRFNNIFTELSLSREQQNLETLAMLYHYYDLPHFHKEYKRYFGIPPGRFVLDNFSLLRQLISDTPYLLQVQQRNTA